MLGHNDVVATIPVSDMGRAREFYEGKLGLILDGTIGAVATVYRAGDTRIFVYQTINPISAQTIVATWAVDDNLELIVSELKAKGITFEYFEREGFVREGDIYRADGFKVALFRDPDGSMLSLFQPDMI
jgi:catechol 2,3-dioxygenase-like lactoylglutathione lyase family enzyme